MNDSKTRLDTANNEFGNELFFIKSNLDVFRVIGLNADAIKTQAPTANLFMWHIHRQALIAASLGITKVFERSKKYNLCSIQGIYKLAKTLPIKSQTSANIYLDYCKFTPSRGWAKDVEDAHKKNLKWVENRINDIIDTRNTFIAHLKQNGPKIILPGMDHYLDLFNYAYMFHKFISRAFLQITPHPIPRDIGVQRSFVSILEQIGVTNPELEYPD